MKKKRKLKTRVLISLVYTLVILQIINSSFVSKTNSKFFSKKEKALQYQTNLYPLYVGNFETKMLEENPAPTKEKFSLQFSFNSHSKIAFDVSEENLDIYNVVVDGCVVTKINDQENVNEIKLDSSEEKEITVQVECSVDSAKIQSVDDAGNPIFRVKLEVWEHIEKDEVNFLYMDSLYEISVEDYKKLLPEEPKPFNKVLEVQCESGTACSTLSSDFKNWISMFAELNPNYSSAITSYVLSAGFEDRIRVDENNIFANPYSGIKMEYDAESFKYTYTIEDNLIGYARTFDWNDNHKNFNLARIYFSSTNKEEVEDAFAEYLEKYIYADDLETLAKVKDYVESQGGIYEFILGNERIPGIYNSNSDDGYILRKSTILACIEKSKKIEHGTALSMELRLMEILHTVYSDIVSGAEEKKTTPGYAYYDIPMNNDIFLSALHGLSNPDEANGEYGLDFSGAIAKSYTDYFVLYDKQNKWYLLINIMSQYDKNPNEYKYNILNIEKLVYQDDSVVSNDVDINFENVDESTLKINISSLDREKVVDVVSALDTYFITNISDAINKGDIVISEVDGKYSVIYTIEKVIYDRNDSNASSVIAGTVGADTVGEILDSSKVDNLESSNTTEIPSGDDMKVPDSQENPVDKDSSIFDTTTDGSILDKETSNQEENNLEPDAKENDNE